jgi:hypothetical protein
MKPIRIALECYGGIRCGFVHHHVERFFESFPFLRGNENIKVDIFILSTCQDRKTMYSIDETFLRNINESFKNQLANFQIFEYLSEDLKREENEIIEKWMQRPNPSKDFVLSEEENKDFHKELFEGIDIQFAHKIYPYHLKDVFTFLSTHNTLILEQDNYVPRLYYRRMIINRLRKEFQEIHSDVHYDWVIMARMFDIDYDITTEEDKHQMEQIFSQPPRKDAVYISIDNLIAGTPEMIDSIYEPLGMNYPVATYQDQWSLTDPVAIRFRETYRKMDDYLYFSRRDMTLSSENQLLMQCIRSASEIIHLRKGYHSHFLRNHIILNNEGFFVPILCPFRM